MKPEEAYASLILGELPSEQIVPLAVKWLEEDYDTPALRLLAGELDISLANLEPIFYTVMKELRIDIHSRLYAAKILVKYNLQKISKEENNLIKVCEYIYWHIHLKIHDEYPDVKYVGDVLGLEHLFAWLREIWDTQDGSNFRKVTTLAERDKEVQKLKKPLAEEVEKVLLDMNKAKDDSK